MAFPFITVVTRPIEVPRVFQLKVEWSNCLKEDAVGRMMIGSKFEETI
jgi:hypothetical protein